MYTNQLKLTQLQNEIFKLLCITVEKKLTQREIARQLKVSASGVGKSLIKLKELNLINLEKDKIMNLSQISLNTNQKTLRFKQIQNLKTLYETGLISFLEEKFPGTTIILFGSYFRGEDLSTSDIDIAIINSKKIQINLKSFEKMLERDINLNFYSSFKEINTELKENLCNGFTLSGGIEL